MSCEGDVHIKINVSMMEKELKVYCVARYSTVPIPVHLT
jgi:hypothetical protein